MRSVFYEKSGFAVVSVSVSFFPFFFFFFLFFFSSFFFFLLYVAAHIAKHLHSRSYSWPVLFDECTLCNARSISGRMP
jgi:hypothetical protein